MALVSDNPLFACGIDDFSETQAVDEVRLLNYDINNFIMDILSSGRLQTSVLCRDDQKDPMTISVGSMSNNYKFSDGKMGEFVVDILFRLSIYDLLYRCFFEGKHFFCGGIGALSRKFGTDDGGAYRVRCVIIILSFFLLLFPIFFLIYFFLKLQ